MPRFSSRPVRSIRLTLLLAAAWCAVAAPSIAEAVEIQTLGPIKWPGRFQVGFHPLGGQVALASPSIGFYKTALDLSYLIKEYPGGLGVWVGAGFNYAVSSTYGFGPAGQGLPPGVFGVQSYAFHDVQLHAFAMLTFNMLAYSLVPFVRFGGAGDVLLLAGNTGGAGGFRFGGGIHYWLLKYLGLGVEMNFLLGGQGTSAAAGFFGTWDFGLGARFAF